jgi:hypothetical protein
LFQHDFVETRLSLIWLALLGAIESTDVLTTALNQARGSIEAMPISAALLNRGGLPLFMGLKLTLVAGAAVAVVLTLRWVRGQRPGSRTVYRFVMSAMRMAVAALAVVSLNNALLLRSLG